MDFSRLRELAGITLGKAVREKELVKGAKFKVDKNDTTFTVEILEDPKDFEVKISTNGASVRYLSVDAVLQMLNSSKSVDRVAEATREEIGHFDFEVSDEAAAAKIAIALAKDGFTVDLTSAMDIFYFNFKNAALLEQAKKLVQHLIK